MVVGVGIYEKNKHVNIERKAKYVKTLMGKNQRLPSASCSNVIVKEISVKQSLNETADPDNSIRSMVVNKISVNPVDDVKRSIES